MSSSVRGEGTSQAEQGLIQGSEIGQPPPEYTSPEGSARSSSDIYGGETPGEGPDNPSPPIPSYDAAVGNNRRLRSFSDTHESR